MSKHYRSYSNIIIFNMVAPMLFNALRSIIAFWFFMPSSTKSLCRDPLIHSSLLYLLICRKPTASLRRPNRHELEMEKLQLYGGCSNTSKFRQVNCKSIIFGIKLAFKCHKASRSTRLNLAKPWPPWLGELNLTGLCHGVFALQDFLGLLYSHLTVLGLTVLIQFFRNCM